jgi:hypothetical protein
MHVLLLDPLEFDLEHVVLSGSDWRNGNGENDGTPAFHVRLLEAEL